MDLDSLLLHYFGTDDPASCDERALLLGRERLALDFGKETEGSRRFALWALMEALGEAPSPDEAFAKDARLREAAHDYRRMAFRVERG